MVKCRAPYIGKPSDFGTAEANVALDTSTGILLQYRSMPGDVLYMLTPGDKIKNSHIPASQYIDSHEDPTTGGPLFDPTAHGPAEIPYDAWWCIVDINNIDHTFKIAPPAPDCDHPGAAVKSFSGITVDDSAVAPPIYSAGQLPGSMNAATTWEMLNAWSSACNRLILMPTPLYVWWSYHGAGALVSAGIAAAIPYYNQG